MLACHACLNSNVTLVLTRPYRCCFSTRSTKHICVSFRNGERWRPKPSRYSHGDGGGANASAYRIADSLQVAVLGVGQASPTTNGEGYRDALAKSDVEADNMQTECLRVARGVYSRRDVHLSVPTSKSRDVGTRQAGQQVRGEHFRLQQTQNFGIYAAMYCQPNTHSPWETT